MVAIAVVSSAGSTSPAEASPTEIGRRTRERSAAALAFTGRVHGSAVQINELPDDGKPETESGVPSIRRVVFLAVSTRVFVLICHSKALPGRAMVTRFDGYPSVHSRAAERRALLHRPHLAEKSSGYSAS
jgi:hypothetical protein